MVGGSSPMVATHEGGCVRLPVRPPGWWEISAFHSFGLQMCTFSRTTGSRNGDITFQTRPRARAPPLPPPFPCHHSSHRSEHVEKVEMVAGNDTGNQRRQNTSDSEHR